MAETGIVGILLVLALLVLIARRVYPTVLPCESKTSASRRRLMICSTENRFPASIHPFFTVFQLPHLSRSTSGSDQGDKVKRTGHRLHLIWIW